VRSSKHVSSKARKIAPVIRAKYIRQEEVNDSGNWRAPRPNLEKYISLLGK